MRIDSCIKIGGVIVGLFIFLFGLQAQESYYFFSDSDKVAIQRSANTVWGKRILENMKKGVEQRRLYKMEVPLLEGGHLHDYFCPVHNLSFVFEWDKPDEHYCAACKKYWKGNKKHDWAWINKLHAENLQYLENCTYLYLATGDTLYASYIRDMLLDYAYKYPTYFEHNTNRVATALNSGKLFGQSLDESVWASDAARAYSVAKDVMTPDEIKKIQNGYLKPCAEMLLKRRGGGNWQVWHNSGLIALGVALEDDKIIDIALNDKQCGYHTLMKMHVHDDGWWNEGSPTYHYYPLRAMMLSAEALRCRGINLYDRKLLNMLSSPAQGVYADLSFPAHNDGWYGESLLSQTKLYELAYARSRDPLFFNILERSYGFVDRNSAEALFNPISIEQGGSPEYGKSTYFKDLGVGVLRYKDKTIVLKYGPYGGGHGHPDKLSVSIHNGKKEILPDLGTSAYGVPDFTEWYRKTLAHNTVTVDGKDQAPVTGKLIRFAPSSTGGTIETEVDNAYEGVVMKRSITLNKNRLSDRFVCESSTLHIYDYVLLFTEPLNLPYEGKSITLTDAPVYGKIQDMEQYIVHGKFSVKTSDAEIRIDPGDNEIELYTGVAPGIPPTNPGVITKDHSEQRETQPCYPLIVRIKNKKIKVQTNWNLK